MAKNGATQTPNDDPVIVALKMQMRLSDQLTHEGPRPELELLLQHRDRLRQSHTWPFDLGLVYRLLLYVVIPPLAWLGAALVETAVEGLISR